MPNIPGPPLDAAQSTEYMKAATTLLCDCGCHPQSVHECACGRAEELRGVVADHVRSGMSGDAVIAKFVAEKGEKILIAPKSEGFNLVAWVGPLAGLFLAAGGLALVLRRWNRKAGPAASAAPPVARDSAWDARLSRELEEYDR
ncbi:MAG TPA: cytochrome c-type biogenesis protein CcmH [Candidatus Polarisedimenticolaceae bacterium]